MPTAVGPYQAQLARELSGLIISGGYNIFPKEIELVLDGNYSGTLAPINWIIFSIFINSL